MILSVHMFFGAAIGYKTYLITNNLWLSVFLALLSHYFLDFFPHVEYLSSTENSIEKIKNDQWSDALPDILKVSIDFFLGILLIFIFSSNHLIIYLFAFFAIIPDGLTVVSSLYPNKITNWHNEIHTQKIHYLTKNKKTPYVLRVLTQATAVITGIIIFY